MPARTPAAERPSLAEQVRASWPAPDAADGFPHNPVLRRLIAERAFEHDGRSYRTAHRMADAVCAFAGRLAIAHGVTRCLEVGTLYGFCTLHLAEAMAATGGTVDTLDLRPAELAWDRHRSETPQTIRNVHEVAERLVADSGLRAQVRFRVGDSNDLLPELIRQDAAYELAVVDGAHDFPSALLDVLSADQLLVPGGWLLLDDVGRRLAQRDANAGGPNRLLAALFASGRYQIVPLAGDTAICRKEAM